MNKEDILKYYECYIYNITSIGFEIKWMTVSDFFDNNLYSLLNSFPHKKLVTDWETTSAYNLSVRMDRNPQLLYEDIEKYGTYLPFSIFKKIFIFNTHKFDAIRNAYLKNSLVKYQRKLPFLFIKENHEIDNSKYYSFALKKTIKADDNDIGMGKRMEEVYILHNNEYILNHESIINIDDDIALVNIKIDGDMFGYYHTFSQLISREIWNSDYKNNTILTSKHPMIQCEHRYLKDKDNFCKYFIKKYSKEEVADALL